MTDSFNLKQQEVGLSPRVNITLPKNLMPGLIIPQLWVHTNICREGWRASSTDKSVAVPAKDPGLVPFAQSSQLWLQIQGIRVPLASKGTAYTQNTRTHTNKHIWSHLYFGHIIVFIFIFRERSRERDRQTERQADSVHVVISNLSLWVLEITRRSSGLATVPLPRGTLPVLDLTVKHSGTEGRSSIWIYAPFTRKSNYITHFLTSKVNWILIYHVD